MFDNARIFTPCSILHWNKKHRDTKTQRHEENAALKSFVAAFSSCLCVFVSLCLFQLFTRLIVVQHFRVAVHRETRRRPRPAVMCAMPHALRYVNDVTLIG